MWLLILSFVFVIFVELSFHAANTEDGKIRKDLAMVIIIIFGVTLFASYGLYDERYKQGQVDVLTGKVKYELITHDDSTKTWEKIEKGENDENR